MQNLLDIIKQSLLAITSGTDRNSITDDKVGYLVDVYNCLLHLQERPMSIFEIHVRGSVERDMDAFEMNIQDLYGCPHLKSALSYFISELICNVEQHAGVDVGYGLSIYDDDKKSLMIGVADGGISIYGSYIKSQKYLSEVGDSDAQALYLAQNGYSTKNRPGTENRGYGISSNSKMVVEGLGGVFAILSGNALFYHNSEGKRIYALPAEAVWLGTLVLAEIPVKEKEFNIYDYIG